MARVHPFRAFRFPPSNLSGRLLPHAVRPPPGHPLAPLEGMADATALLRQWAAAGALRQEASPAMYVLELADGRPAPVRYLLCATDELLPPLEEDGLRPRAAGAVPVPALAADDHGVLRDLVAGIAAGTPPEVEVRYAEALLRLWRVDQADRVERARQILEEAPVRPLEPLGPGRNLLAVLPLSDPGLRLTPIHRGILGVPTFQPERFLTVVAGYARVYDLDLPLTHAAGIAAAMERLGTIARGQHGVLLVLPGGVGKVLRFRQGLELSQFKAVPRNPTLRSLDLTLLNALVLQTVLGLKEPERVDHPQVRAVLDVPTLLRELGQGTFQAGFALNPPPLWEIRAVIEAQQTLPPRTAVIGPLPPMGLMFLAQEE